MKQARQTAIRVRHRARRRAAAWSLVFALAALVPCTAGRSLAQGLVIQAPVPAGAAGGDAASPDEPKRPFSLPAQKSEVTESLTDFRRYAGKGTWERAFKALEKVQAADANTLTPSSEGLYLPTRLLIRQALAELPPAGKQAYRLFHDADAKALYEAAHGKDEVEKLQQVFNDHFITSVGDLAADRLGDIYFEQGDMDKAAECWLAVLRWCPESALPRVRLLVKSAIAEARGGHWDAFAQLKADVRQRHAEESVVLGGKQVSAESYLDAFEKQNHAASPSTGVAQAAPRSDLSLPAVDAPAWQFRFLPPQTASTFAQVGMNWGWNARFPVTEMVPAVAHDDKRVYLNFLGYLMAIDLHTGKLLWRSGRIADIGQKVQQSQYHYPEQYTIAVSGDTLWCVTREVAHIGQHGQPFRIGRWEAATGKPGWNSQNVADLQQWNIMGAPLAAGDRVYVAAAKNGQGAELHALALQASNGKLLWSTRLGTHQADPTQMWNRRSTQPSLVLGGGTLYVDSHAGALIALDAMNGSIAWAFGYDSTMADTNNFYNQPAEFTTAAPPLVQGNTLYLKGMHSDRLYALDVSIPKLRWKRRVDQGEMLVAVDQETVYLAGEEVQALDLADKDLRMAWANRLPSGTPWIKPLLSEHRVYQFTSRGIFELDRTNGDPVRLFRGSDLGSLGGMLLAAQDRLLSVSNIAVTAYSLENATPAEAAADHAIEASSVDARTP